MTSTSEQTSSQPFDHNRAYYDSFTPPYETLSEVWNGHFGRAAEQVIQQINPSSVIDAGCAVGVLVRQFAARGIEAIGFDSSADAIAIAVESDPSLDGKVFLHDVSKLFRRKADAVICIEVLEHLPASDAASAVFTLCHSALKHVVFSSTAEDVISPQHPNVQPQEYWDALFLANGFRRTTLSAWCFCPWAVIYERTHPIEDDPVTKNEETLTGTVIPPTLADPLETKIITDLQDVQPGEFLNIDNGNVSPVESNEEVPVKAKTKAKKVG